MKAALISTACVLFAVAGCFAEGPSPSPTGRPAPIRWTDRFYWGGGVGASFGDTSSVFVAPNMGFAFTPAFSAGLGVFYLYQEYENIYATPPADVSVSTNDYGFDVFGRYRFVPQFFGQVGYSYTNYEAPLSNGGTTRDSYTGVLAGGGFVQPLGGSTSFVATFLYDFRQSDDEPGPYSDPWIVSVGVTVGF